MQAGPSNFLTRRLAAFSRQSIQIPISKKTHSIPYPRQSLSSSSLSNLSRTTPKPGSSSIRYASTISYQSTRSRLFRPTTIVLIFVPILTGFLGVWQIQRLKWKVALIEEVEKNLAKQPMMLPDRINMTALPDFMFRRVLVRGTLSGPPILLGPQVRDGVPGYALILPLHRPNKATTILLNRGFITTTRAQAIRNGTLSPPGIGETVEVEGMLMKPGEMGVFTHQNDLEKNEWFWRDVVGMAEYVGGEKEGVQPVLVDALDYGEQPSSLLMQQGIPLGRPPQIELRNQHASYATIWFSLSAATAAMLVFVLRKGRGGPRLDPRRRDL